MLKCPGCGSQNIDLSEVHANFFDGEFIIDLHCLHCGLDLLAICPVRVLDSSAGVLCGI